MSFQTFARSGVAALALAPLPAAASEWWYVNSGPGRVVFVDAKSIERRKDVVTYWTMHVIRPAEPEVMTKTHMRADCGRRTLGYLSEIRYDASGRQIGSSPSRPGPMQAVPPDTLGDAEFHFACGDDGYRVTNDLFPVAIDEVAFAEALLAGGNDANKAHALHEAMAHKQAPVSEEVAKPQDDPEPAAAAVDPEDAAARIQQLDTDCTAGDGDACTLLGIAYHKGEGVEHDEVRAARLFEQACERGGPSACGNFGLALVTGNGVPKDAARAFGYFTAGCDRGDASSCASLGATYSMGIAVKQDHARARTLFKKACDGGDENGCYNLGVVYDQGLGVKKDAARAVPLYVRACDADEGAACGNLGTLVQSGLGVARDAVRAAGLFAKACGLDDADGCLNLGRAYQAGSGVARDVDKAADGYRRALAIEPDKAEARRALVALSAN